MMTNDVNKAVNFFGLRIPLKSKEEIKNKYRELAMKYHPDRGGKEEDFKLLGEYKNILEKNFHKLNSNCSKIEQKKEIYKNEEVFIKRQKNTKNYLELIGYKIENIIGLIIFYICAFCLLLMLFLLPMSFFQDFGPIVEPNYIYGIVSKEAIYFLLKITIIYLIYLLLYSILYHLVIKKKLIQKLQNSKLPIFLRETLIYYFIGLYLSVFIINKFITIILI